MTSSAEGQPKIRPEHLDRAAYVYVRQSSLYQVEHHREGRLRQYDLVAWAREVGWAKERIVVLDEDQGKSSAIPQTRAGFGDLIARVGRGEVGMVISLEVERLARNNVDWHHLNPYLGIAAFIAAGLDGIHRKLDPGEPNVGRNMDTLPLDAVKRDGLTLIPQSLPEALDAFEADPVIQAALGPELAAELLKVKRQEWVRYHNTVSQWEIDRYLALF